MAVKYQGVIKYKQKYPDSHVVWEKEWASDWWKHELTCKTLTDISLRRMQDTPGVEVIHAFILDSEARQYDVYGPVGSEKPGQKLEEGFATFII